MSLFDQKDPFRKATPAEVKGVRYFISGFLLLPVLGLGVWIWLEIRRYQELGLTDYGRYVLPLVIFSIPISILSFIVYRLRDPEGKGLLPQWLFSSRVFFILAGVFAVMTVVAFYNVFHATEVSRGTSKGLYSLPALPFLFFALGKRRRLQEAASSHSDQSK